MCLLLPSLGLRGSGRRAGRLGPEALSPVPRLHFWTQEAGLGRERGKGCLHLSEQNHPRPTPPKKIRPRKGGGRGNGVASQAPEPQGEPKAHQLFDFFLFSPFSLFRLCLCAQSFLHVAPRSCPGPRRHLTRSTDRGTSSLSSSRAGSPRACGLSCASAWRRGWGSTPCRWCTGRARRRCACAGA